MSLDLLSKHMYFAFKFFERFLCLFRVLSQVSRHCDDALYLEIELKVLLCDILQNLSWILKLFPSADEGLLFVGLWLLVGSKIAKLALILKQNNARNTTW